MSIDIPEVVRSALGAAGPLHLATVVDRQGPCYRKIGARLLVGNAGRLAGSVSGGCLERDLVRRIAWLVERGPRVETFDTSADGDEMDRTYLGCGGTIRVLLERAEERTLALLAWVAERAAPCAIVTVLESDDASVPLGTSHAVSGEELRGEPAWGDAAQPLVRTCLSEGAHVHGDVGTARGSLRVLVEYVPPPRRLLIAGRHYDTAPLVRLATECGWHVCVASEPSSEDLGAPPERIALTRPALRAWLERSPDAAMVIMTHSIPLDRLCLETALHADTVRYMGVLGPADRSQKLLAAIQEQGPVPETALARLRAPAGIALGGEGAAAIALSIVAELEQTFARRIPNVGN